MKTRQEKSDGLSTIFRGSRSSKNKSHPTKRSTAMKPSTGCKLVRRGLTTLLFMGLIATLALGQNLVIGSGSTYTGAGSYVVKGNITNSGVAAATSIAGTVTMSSTTAAQTIGTGGQGDINWLVDYFAAFNISGVAIPSQAILKGCPGKTINSQINHL